MKKITKIISAMVLSFMIMTNLGTNTANAQSVFGDYDGQQISGDFTNCCDTSSNSSNGSVFGDYGGQQVSGDFVNCCDTSSGSDTGYLVVPDTVYGNSGYSNYGGYSSYTTPTVYSGYTSSSYTTPRVYGGSGSSSYTTPSSSWYSNVTSNTNTTNTSNPNNSGNTHVDNSSHSTPTNSWYSNATTNTSNSNNYSNTSNTNTSTSNPSNNGNTYIDNSSCIGTNNCNVTHSNIVSNSTSVNGNYNNVNTSSGGTTANSSGSIAISCSTGYTPQNGNCVQNAIYNPTPIYNHNCVSGYHWVGNVCYPDIKYINTPTCVSGYYLSGNSCYPYNNNNYNNSNYSHNYNNFNYNNTPTYVAPIVYNMPMVRISASPSLVASGGYTTLNWAANNASYCQASGDWSGSPTLVGSRTVNNLIRTMTFNITCYNNNGQSANDSVIVGVTGISSSYVAPYNRAVTNLPTHVTDSSAVCNGMAISNNNLANTGYFEVREYNNASQITRSFNTSSANIGNHTTNVYAAPINGLKNHTKYSCRAIVNNTTGVLKGEEITFVTGNTVKALTNYIYTNYKSHTKPKVKNLVVCNDNSGNKMSIINEGDIQMLDLSVNKISPEMKVGEVSYFSITLRNKGGVDIKNVKVKLSLDKGVTLVNSNDWHIDRSSDNTFTNSIDTLYKGSEKTYIVKQEININNGVPVSSAISNVTATYEVNTNKGVMSNEASAFAMYQVINNKVADTINKDLETRAKTENTKNDKDKTDKDKTLGQYIDSLSAIEIISILIIITLIIFLSNNIYKAVNKKRREKRSIHTVTEEYKH